MAVEERRAQIVATARQLFGQYGYAGTKMRTVAERAGITEPLLYRHFHSKGDLYKEAFLNPLDEFIEGLITETHSLAGRSGMKRSEVLQHFHELFLRHLIPVAPLFAASLVSGPNGGVTLYDDALLPRVRAMIAEVFADLSGLAVDSIGADLIARSLLGVYFGLAMENVLQDREPDPATLAGQLTLIFAPGLSRNRKRRKPSRPLPEGLAIFSLESVPSTNGRTRLPRAERRQVVQAAAREVFTELGVNGAKSKDIAQRAGTTEAILYRLFGSKDEIYLEAVQRPVIKAFAELAMQVKILGHDRSGTEFLQSFNELGIRFFVVHAPVVKAALFSDLALGSQLYRELEPNLKEVEDVVVDRIGGTDPRIDPKVLRRTITGAQLGIGLDRRLRGRPEEIRQVAASLTTVFTGGIRDTAP